LQPKFINEKQGYNLAAIGSIKLDILPIQEVAMTLFDRLKKLNVKNIDEIKATYLTEEVFDSEKLLNMVYRKIIKDFQNQKFGKIILD